MNPDLDQLKPYPFETLAKLREGVVPNPALEPIALTIGEPRHAPPEFVLDTLREHIMGVAKYPAIGGIPELRTAIAQWLGKRFSLNVTPDIEREVLPVTGTREALFAFIQATLDRTRPARVLVPNPFYQIYEGATLLAGGEVTYLPCPAENGFRPDYAAVPADVWRDTQIVFICSPGNPTGAVTPLADFQQLIRLADKHDFLIASDECYSELYLDEATPPPGLLEACAAMGRDDYTRCVVFHSLSKRSNLPGLRSGFVAGDGEVIRRFRHYRTYHGCAMPLHHQYASIAAWNDEAHVLANRDAYREKFTAVTDILAPVMDFPTPEASFYLYPAVPGGDDAAFTRELLREEAVGVLPASYMAREVDGVNPGTGRIRLALVAELAQTVEAAQRLRRFVERIR